MEKIILPCPFFFSCSLSARCPWFPGFPWFPWVPWFPSMLLSSVSRFSFSNSIFLALSLLADLNSKNLISLIHGCINIDMNKRTYHLNILHFMLWEYYYFITYMFMRDMTRCTMQMHQRQCINAIYPYSSFFLVFFSYFLLNISKHYLDRTRV